MKDKYQIKEKQRGILGARDEDIDNPILRAKDEILGFLLGDMDSPVESILHPPTNDYEIDELIKEVKVEYEGIPEFSMFGDPNWKVRDAEIEMLEWAKGG